MKKKCYKCGSDNVAKVVSGNAAFIPEVKKDLIAGRCIGLRLWRRWNNWFASLHGLRF